MTDPLRLTVRPVLEDDAREAATRLIMRQEGADLILQVLGLTDDDTTTTPRRKAAPVDPHAKRWCTTHDMAKRYMQSGGFWRCRACHNEANRGRTKARKEAK